MGHSVGEVVGSPRADRCVLRVRVILIDDRGATPLFLLVSRASRVIIISADSRTTATLNA